MPTKHSYRRRRWYPTPVLLSGKSHGRRGLVGCSPWGRWESDTTEWLHFSFSLSCIGEGNGNTLQCSCLENSMDRGAWLAAARRVVQSRTRLKQLSMHACIGERNGNPLHCSCLENPRDRGTWWAAIYGVAQSRHDWINLAAAPTAAKYKKLYSNCAIDPSKFQFSSQLL